MTSYPWLRRTLHVLFALLIAASPALSQTGVPPEAAEQVDAGRDVFVGVGVDEYADREAWPPLAAAVNDVVGLRDVLVEGYGFQSPDEWLLLDADATGEAVRGLVDDLYEHLQPDDRLVFVFAGHALAQEDSLDGLNWVESFLIPSDASPHPSTLVGVDDLLSNLAGVPARHVLVILDATYTGLALGDALKQRGGGSVTDPAELRRRTSRRVLSSAQENQRVFDGGDQFPGNSLFAGWLLEGLRRGIDGEGQTPDANGDGFITGAELAAFASEGVLTASDAMQTPDFGAFELDGRGGMVLELPIAPGGGR